MCRQRVPVRIAIVGKHTHAGTHTQWRVFIRPVSVVDGYRRPVGLSRHLDRGAIRITAFNAVMHD